MAWYIVSYRISRYWGHIVAYLYRDNYPSNEVDILHNSQSPSMPSMPSVASTKGVSCSVAVAGAGKVTLIGSNCPASRVGQCVDCEGGRTAQIFSDCAITRYLSRATARRPCGRQIIAGVDCGVSTAAIVWRPVLTVALLNNPGLQGTPAARRRSPRRSPTTVASPDGQYPGTCSGDSVDRQNDGAPVVCRCAVACLLAVLTYGEALSDRIVSYRIVIFCVISYRIISCSLWLYRAITIANVIVIIVIKHFVYVPQGTKSSVVVTAAVQWRRYWLPSRADWLGWWSPWTTAGLGWINAEQHTDWSGDQSRTL